MDFSSPITQGSDLNMNYRRLVGLAVILCGTTGLGHAQQLNFDSLPGVTADQGPSLNLKGDAGPKPECTTAFEAFGTETSVPKRVYKCKQGNITITSETPPPGY